MKNNLVLEKSFSFSLKIISVYKQLAEGKEYVLSKQLLRSGTSIGANCEEASAAQTKKDFITKMSIASKEAREVRYWIRLLKASGYMDKEHPIEAEADELIRILTAIVKTSQASLNK